MTQKRVLLTDRNRNKCRVIGVVSRKGKVMETKSKRLSIIARILYLAVFISNMICIVAFIIDPESYTYSYGLKGAVGSVAAIQGIGVAFAMWNVTYPFFILRRKNDKTLGMIIIVQQIVGLVGEVIIRAGLAVEAEVLNDSILRFIYFDAGGLILLIIGLTLVYRAEA